MLIDAFSAAALAITLPGTCYLGLLTAAAIRSPSPGHIDRGSEAERVVVLIPAHNESTGLLRTLYSLRPEVEADPMARIVVVADNCSDDTAEVARAAGVDVIERREPAKRGKGYALDFGITANPDTDWFIVIDADTDVGPDFLPAMRRAMPGADALQCRYGVRDPLASRRNTLADVALAGWNVVRPRGRAQIGWSAGILGNGFALSRRTLDLVPYSARSIVEDVEYHLLLLRAGLRVRWVDDATVRGDMPEGNAADQQRARWEGGRLRLVADRMPDLLIQMLKGSWRMLDPLLDLALLPLSWHVSILLVVLLIGQNLSIALAAFSLGVVALHVLVALVLMGAGPAHRRALLGIPAYLCWKLSLLGKSWRAAGRQATWVRSVRTPRKDTP